MPDYQDKSAAQSANAKPKKKKKTTPRKKSVDRPANLEKQEYDTYELDDVEDDR